MHSEKDELLKLTLAVYRVTDRFPENEPLKYSIRETAGRIFNFAVSSQNGGPGRLQSDFELLQTYLFIAKIQNWVAERNFLALEKEYDKVKQSFCAGSVKPLCEKCNGKNGIKAEKREIVKQENGKTAKRDFPVMPPYERKQKISDIIKEREKIALRELLASFPEMSKRTLIRDLENLIKEEHIKKEGNGRHVIYMPNGRSTMVTS